MAIYSVSEVQTIEHAVAGSAGSALCAFQRVVLRTELRKIYAALRNDDACWDRPREWSFAGGAEGL